MSSLMASTSADSGQLKKASEQAEACKVCGDENGKVHYGITTCFGCKGFFRRTVKRQIEYTCRKSGNCTVDKLERNACRHCRFKKCLEVGMDPKAVRPDRDSTQRANLGRPKKKVLEEEREVDAEWARKLPFEMRTMLMQILSIDLVVGAGDGLQEPTEVYPLSLPSVRAIFSNINLLQGKRNEMRYDSIREIVELELPRILHRRIIAMIDWTYQLFELMDYKNYDDAVELVRYGFAPMTVFTFCSNTARMTRRPDIISLNTFGYIQRDSHKKWSEPYHFANNLAERCLDDLIEPFRQFSLQEEEISLLKAIIALNPLIKGLSREGKTEILKLRNRLYETLYYVSRELHPNETASSRFGNLLMFMPIVMRIGEVLVDNVMTLNQKGRVTDMLLLDVLKGMNIKYKKAAPVSESMPNNDDDDDIICVSPERAPTTSSASTSKSPDSASSNAHTPSSSCKLDTRKTSMTTPPEVNAVTGSASSAPNTSHMVLMSSNSMPHDNMDTDLELALDYINDTHLIVGWNQQSQITPTLQNPQLARRSSLPYELDGHYSSSASTSNQNKSPNFYYSNAQLPTNDSYHQLNVNPQQSQQYPTPANANFSSQNRHRPYYSVGKAYHQISHKQMSVTNESKQPIPIPNNNTSGFGEIHHVSDVEGQSQDGYSIINPPQVLNTTGQYFGETDYHWNFNNPTLATTNQPMVHAAAGTSSHASGGIDYNCESFRF